MTATSTWVVYILECGDGTFYTGITTNIEERIKKHESGSGARYTKGRGPLRLMYLEWMDHKASASRRERAIKSLPRTKKEELVKTYQA